MRTGRVKGIVSPMWCRRLLISKMSPNQLDAVSSSLRPGKFATAFCSGRCASVSWFNPARGTADGRTFPPWRTSAAWQDVRVSYGVVSDHCKPPAGYLKLLSEAAGPRGGKARRPQRGKTRRGPRLVKKPGQNGQAMRALDGIGPVIASIGRPPVVATTSISGSFASAARVGIIS